MSNILEFKKRVKVEAPVGTRYVTICINEDGSDGFIEHSDTMNGYEVLGVLEWGKMLKLAECDLPQPEPDDSHAE